MPPNYSPTPSLLRSLCRVLREPTSLPSRSHLRVRARSAATFTHPRHAQAISVLPTLVDKTSQEYKDNATQVNAIMAKYADLHQKISNGGPQKARDKHVQRGKMLARDRVTALVDPGSPFLELSPLAAHEVYEDEIPAAGVVAGIGTVEGVTCMIVANDATVKGGTYYPLTVKKHLRAQEIVSLRSNSAIWRPLPRLCLSPCRRRTTPTTSTALLVKSSRTFLQRSWRRMAVKDFTGADKLRILVH